VSSVDRPLRWDKVIHCMFESYYLAPPLQSMWYIFCVFSTNHWVVYTLRFLLHRIPGAFMDLSFLIRGKKPK